jgi:hypothetical protein
VLDHFGWQSTLTSHLVDLVLGRGIVYVEVGAQDLQLIVRNSCSCPLLLCGRHRQTEQLLRGSPERVRPAKSRNKAGHDTSTVGRNRVKSCHNGVSNNVSNDDSDSDVDDIIIII